MIDEALRCFRASAAVADAQHQKPGAQHFCGAKREAYMAYFMEATQARFLQFFDRGSTPTSPAVIG